ncbi:MAG: NADH-quinone oxidoreductase subunit C [Verrucomicrobia bacterium]|nr:NADH-quinone oxidoreductase subunit C [Verrucomicrobiota bacterium]
MESPEQIRGRLLTRFPDAAVAVVANPGPAAQHSLLLDPTRAVEIAAFLRDDPALRLDFCSNVTGLDWPEREVIETIKKTVPLSPVTGAAAAGATAPGPSAEPATKIVEEKIKRLQPGCLEVVYHLYSMALKHGPVILRLRTGNRADQVSLPSLTPIWRSCEFQEREVFDLFGVVFRGHPDLRRILMWDEFRDHPMRKDYVEPDDYEWEPTPHEAVLAKARAHYPTPAPGAPAAPAP